MEETSGSVLALDEQILERIRTEVSRTQRWLKFLGVLSFILSPISIVALFLKMILSPGPGIIQLIAGLIIGGLSMLLAAFLLASAKKAGAYADNGQPEDLIRFNGKLSVYFTISGILILVVLIGLILGVVFALTSGLFKTII
ncbi:hypothetical protein GF359_07600 [candidate division WOR-3 bacterium]|uniref:DUF5362 domain-containing protein n=1 Tax=candidate division WOR-3 bacterium TaxID=2052148 RepID=A0A9D5KBE7_UNCW3|nr:hypothetical protein [candidate division WOR-3 bacterium]MBD3365065.1 hypothetical protein [candidate division WOR-3 bacterium]